jgi:Domain of unknown function (DUF4430)
MNRRPAVAIGLLLGAALAAAGCGFGAGRGIGEVSLTVTRDFGARRLLGPRRDAAREADTAMRLLDREAEISTRYGGGFVQAIDGLSEASRGGRRFDWFFYVNGVESPVGAADYPLHGGDAVWWDYRDWSAAESVPAVVGSWPQPFRDGYEGKRRPAVVECRGGGAACRVVAARLRAAGAALAGTSARGDAVATAAGSPSGPSGAGGDRGAARIGGGSPEGAIRVLVGPWARLHEDQASAQLEAGPRASGVYATFAPTPRRSALRGPQLLQGLGEGGGEARAFGPGAGLVAATRRYEAPPVWMVTGATQRGVAAAARLLDAADLRGHYAVAVEAGRTTPLPVGAERR